MVFPFQLQCLNGWPIEMRKTLYLKDKSVTPASSYVGRSKKQESCF